jgi:hydrogenase nickel incorporation protein HypA/HybF
MHELSIASAILDSVAAEVARRPGSRATKVGVRIGEISGIDADALAFGFEALVKNSEWEPLSLAIEHRPRMQRCRSCAHEFAAANSETVCPKCGAADT